MRRRFMEWLVGAIVVTTVGERASFAMPPPPTPLPLQGRALRVAQFDCSNCEGILNGDFDGDGFRDYAYPIREFVDTVPGKLGIRVHLGGSDPWVEIGAGRRNGGAPTDFRDVSAWWVIPHAKLKTLWRGPCPRGDAIWIQKGDASAGLLVVVGGRPKWQWLQRARGNR